MERTIPKAKNRRKLLFKGHPLFARTGLRHWVGSGQTEGDSKVMVRHSQACGLLKTCCLGPLASVGTNQNCIFLSNEFGGLWKRSSRAEGEPRSQIKQRRNNDQ